MLAQSASRANSRPPLVPWSSRCTGHTGCPSWSRSICSTKRVSPASRPVRCTSTPAGLSTATRWSSRNRRGSRSVVSLTRVLSPGAEAVRGPRVHLFRRTATDEDMLFLISPAKALDYDTPPHVKTHTQPLFVPQAQELIGVLREKSPQEIAALMKLSDPLAGLNVARYQAWSPTFTARNAKQAVLAFDGDVYGGLDAKSMD